MKFGPNILISNWTIGSESTAKLITGMFKNLANQNDIRSSEALRRSMISVMNDAKNPEYAHPKYWAPFSVIGAGN